MSAPTGKEIRDRLDRIIDPLFKAKSTPFRNAIRFGILSNLQLEVMKMIQETLNEKRDRSLED